MRMTTVKDETSIGALADRLFAGLTPETRKAAEGALLKANPHLGRADAFQPGAPVELPNVPGVIARPSAAAHDPVADVLSGFTAAVAAYGTELAGNLDAALADIEEQIALLKRRDVVVAVKADDAATELAKALAESLKERAKSLADEKKRHQKLFQQIAKDIASLEA